jgi:Tol biopolymer transport system component
MSLRRLATWLTVAFVGVVMIAALVVGLLPDEQGERAATTTADEQGEGAATTTADALTGTQAQYAPRPFLVDLATGEMTLLAESLAGGAIAFVPSPDGTRLAFDQCSSALCSLTDAMKVANIDGSGVRMVESPKGLHAGAARWSPDSTRLVYQEREAETIEFGNLVVEDLASGRRMQVTDFKPGTGAGWYFLWPRFSPDGQNIIFHFPRSSNLTPRFDVWSVPVTGGKLKLVLRDASFPVPFPDGKRIAYVPGARGFDDHSIAIADSHGSRPRTLVKTDESIWWPSVSPDGSKIAYSTSASGWASPSGKINVVKVSTGATTVVAKGTSAEWLDDDTLIISPCCVYFD